MPFALIVIGLLLIVSGARGTYPQLKTLLISDFTGPHSFLQWIVAIGAVGLLGYVPSLEKFSRVFLTLIVISMFLAERGFFAKFQEALNNVSAGSGAGSPASVAAGTSQSGVDQAAAAGGLRGAIGAIDSATGNSSIGSFVTSILGR